ncbi:MAG: hypothetical protein IKL10_02905 [Clostridia bacterium]|nr:hypothetical protein [Clostridia bacterium]
MFEDKEKKKEQDPKKKTEEEPIKPGEIKGKIEIPDTRERRDGPGGN